MNERPRNCIKCPNLGVRAKEFKNVKFLEVYCKSGQTLFKEKPCPDEGITPTDKAKMEWEMGIEGRIDEDRIVFSQQDGYEPEA